MGKLNKLVFHILTIAVCIITLTGCETKSPAISESSDTNQVCTEQTDIQTEKPEDTKIEKALGNQGDKLELFVKELEKNGFRIGERSSKAYDLLGATRGYGIKVNDGEIPIELYWFDENNLNEEADEIVKSTQKDSQFEFIGISFKGKYKSGVLLTAYQFHPDQEKIVEIFDNYDFN